jgi:hypothetical protein
MKQYCYHMDKLVSSRDYYFSQKYHYILTYIWVYCYRDVEQY